jgi:hypothetical protein
MEPLMAQSLDEKEYEKKKAKFLYFADAIFLT